MNNENNPQNIKSIEVKDILDLGKAYSDRASELEAKRKAVTEHRIEKTFAEIEEAKKELEAIKSLDFDLKNNQLMMQAIKKGREYMDSASQCMRFINDDFNGKVPFYPKNIILLGAYSGDGKSTSTANIVFDGLCQQKKILVISNEEAASDVYNRVTCLAKGWSYSNHEKFTADQKDILDRSAEAMATRLYVVDNDHGGADRLTTSYEGIVSILSNIEKQDTKYDIIIIDYYQNISEMKADPKMDQFKVQAKFVKYIDQFKNRYPAPIVIMAQLKPVSLESPLPFKERIEGTKAIFNVCTFAVEARADKANYRTEWVFHKSRFNNCQGQKMFTGWSFGKYVTWNDEFKIKIEDLKIKQASDKLRLANGGR